MSDLYTYDGGCEYLDSSFTKGKKYKKIKHNSVVRVVYVECDRDEVYALSEQEFWEYFTEIDDCMSVGSAALPPHGYNSDITLKTINYLRDLADKIENDEAFIEKISSVRESANFGVAREEITIQIIAPSEEDYK